MDYKNIKLLKKYVSENGKILPSRITSVSQKKQTGNKKGRQSNFAKLSIFQPNKYKFKKTCPLSTKGAPAVDYKNVGC